MPQLINDSYELRLRNFEISTLDSSPAIKKTPPYKYKLPCKTRNYSLLSVLVSSPPNWIFECYIKESTESHVTLPK